jgi:murein L,D-transpeptidase YcbB/YkuD
MKAKTEVDVRALLLLSICVPVVLPRPLSQQMPQQQCGWPRLCPACKFSNGTVRIAQRLLSSALNDSAISADGIFSPELQAAIGVFQVRTGLNATSAMDTSTWEALIASISPLAVGDKGASVAALQVRLLYVGCAHPR